MSNVKRSWLCGGVVLFAAALAITQFFPDKSRNVFAAPPNSPVGGGSNSSSKQPLDSKDVSLDQAQSIIDAAMKKAQQLNIKEDIAVVDAGGNLKAFVRMDYAWTGSIDIAIKKAKTSRMFDMPSGEIGKQAQPGGPLYHIEFSNGGLITFPGGVPLRTASDTVIGAIGASGSTVEN
ncbi:MAG TPA: heme-binding protein, partial [Tepidisphaeraceae bacterium]|nr:heme-binding protein [Tepidisphaeraceae bacterium]